MMCFQIVPETPQKEHEIEVVGKLYLNQFSTSVPLLYPLKTSENLQFSDVFREYRSGTLVENGLNYVDKITGDKHAIRTSKKTTSRESLQLRERSKSLWVTKLSFIRN